MRRPDGHSATGEYKHLARFRYIAAAVMIMFALENHNKTQSGASEAHEQSNAMGTSDAQMKSN